MIDREVPLLSRGHRRDLGGGPEHLLVEVVDLAVLHLEVPPESAPKPASLCAMALDRPPPDLVERARLVGRERPFAHLRVRARGDVDAPDRWLALEPLGRGDGRQPFDVRLERLEEPIDPPARAPALFPGGRPGAEL